MSNLTPRQRRARQTRQDAAGCLAAAAVVALSIGAIVFIAFYMATLAVQAAR